MSTSDVLHIHCVSLTFPDEMISNVHLSLNDLLCGFFYIVQVTEFFWYWYLSALSWWFWLHFHVAGRRWLVMIDDLEAQCVRKQVQGGGGPPGNGPETQIWTSVCKIVAGVVNVCVVVWQVAVMTTYHRWFSNNQVKCPIMNIPELLDVQLIYRVTDIITL